MEKVIDRLLQIKNKDNFWFGFFANQILTEYDFDYKQECRYLKNQLTDLEQENDELLDQVDELERRIEELENGYDA